MTIHQKYGKRLLSLALGSLFFVGLWVTLRSGGGWLPVGGNPDRGMTPPSVVVLAERFSHGKGTGELLFVRAAGQLRARRRIPGSLGLMAQWQTLAALHHQLFVAVGRGFWLLDGRHGAFRFIPSPQAGAAALQVFQWHGQVYAVTERANAAAWLWVWKPQRGQFASGTMIPWGLTRFLPGRTHPWLLLLRPHSAVWWWPGQRAVVWDGTPEGTGSAIDGRWLPVEAHNQFELWFAPRGHPRQMYTAHSASQDILAVSPTAPLWLATVGGLVPLSRRGPEERRLVRWPAPLQTTVTLASQGSWDLVMDGPDQGWWFNATAGKFNGYLAPVSTAGWMPLALLIWPR